MGWLFTKSLRPGETPADYLKREAMTYSHLEADARPAIVDEATVPGAVFFAMRYPKAFHDRDPGLRDLTNKIFVPDLEGSVTICVVFMIQHDPRASDGYTFGYKDMDETSGPYATGCPQRLLRKLSPLTDRPEAQYARDFRARQQAVLDVSRKKQALRPGMVVRFPQPLTFSNGAVEQQFTVALMRVGRRKGPSRVFIGDTTKAAYAITARQLADAHITEGKTA